MLVYDVGEFHVLSAFYLKYWDIIIHFITAIPPY